MGQEKVIKKTSSSKEGFLITELQVSGVGSELDGITILQLSDFHFGPATKASHLRKAIEISNSLEPDYAVLTGDFIQLSHIGLRHFVAKKFGPEIIHFRDFRRSISVAAKDLAEIISGLKVREKIFGVFGNHDHHEGVSSVRRQLNPLLTWLNNENVSLSKGLHLAGIDDYRNGIPDLDKVVQNIPDQDQFNICLLYTSDAADE